MTAQNPRARLRRLLTASLLAGTMLGGITAGGVLTASAQETPKEGAIQPPQLSHPLPDFVNLVKTGEAGGGEHYGENDG